MADSLDDTYQRLCEHARQTMLLTTIDAIIGWDERCLMPPDGGEYRAEQMTLLAGMIHDRQTDSRIGEWLDELDDGPLTKDVDSDSAVNIRQLRRQYDKKTKLPKTLVEELARTSVLGQQVWQEARKKNDFKLLQPLLEKTFHLKRQQADALGYTGARYDALLDDYEQGETTAEVTRVLAGLREQLVPLVAEVSHSAKRPDSSILERHFPPARQEVFGKETAEKIGFDFKRGRLDVTAHPFCTTLGPHDIRITTRYIDKFFNSGFFGILHEAGHGLYELGLRAEQFGLPAGEAVSLGIHESQSRWWENLVGRSRAFWQYFYPAAKTAYPEALGNVPLDTFYFAINEVKPSLIRVEADEATYNLHILIRFELEQALIDGDLAVADLPGAWNDKYRAALGIVSPTDADGVLQDIHWSAGLVGYFATYSLGNLYASQFFEQARADLGDLDTAFAKGDFAPLLAWLREKIHRHGQRYTSGQLCERITGKPLDHDPLMRHLRTKLGPLYNL